MNVFHPRFLGLGCINLSKKCREKDKVNAPARTALSTLGETADRWVENHIVPYIARGPKARPQPAPPAARLHQTTRYRRNLSIDQAHRATRVRVYEGSCEWYQIADAEKYPSISKAIGLYRSCVLTKLAHMKLSNPCLWTLASLTVGNVPLELPPGHFEREARPTENSLISSSMIIGKVSSPIFESLRKTETSSKALLSFFMLVCRRGRMRRELSHGILSGIETSTCVSHGSERFGHLLVRFLFYRGNCGGYLDGDFWD